MTRRILKLDQRTETQLRRLEALISDRGSHVNMLANNLETDPKRTVALLRVLQERGRAHAELGYWHRTKPAPKA
jgi:hypothetical protein